MKETSNLNFIFHNPNSKDDTRKFIIKLFAKNISESEVYKRLQNSNFKRHST